MQITEILERHFTNTKFLLSFSVDGSKEYIDYWCRANIDGEILNYVKNYIYPEPKEIIIKRRGNLMDYKRRHEAK